MEIEALEAILMDDFRAVREEVSSLEKRFSFGASLDLDLLGIDIDDNILIRGLAVATSRAKPFTATLLLVIPEDDSDVLIDCKNVFKSFGEKHILRGVSFKIRHGEAVGIIRPSGIGKSTILKIIAGLLAPDKVNCLTLILWYCDEKGEVNIRGKKREGLISDEEVSISGLRIGLVRVSDSHLNLLVWLCSIYGCSRLHSSVYKSFKALHYLIL